MRSRVQPAVAFPRRRGPRFVVRLRSAYATTSMSGLARRAEPHVGPGDIALGMDEKADRPVHRPHELDRLGEQVSTHSVSSTAIARTRPVTASAGLLVRRRRGRAA